LLKDGINLIFRALGETDRQRCKQPYCGQKERTLYALGEYFASFAVKIFCRKVRKGTPQRSQRKTRASKIPTSFSISRLHVDLHL
jgi:hypothetical protein